MKEKDLTLHIFSGDNDVTLAFPPTTKIKEIENIAITELGLEGGNDTFELVYNGKTLEPEDRPLLSFHIPEKACLELVATGQGV